MSKIADREGAEEMVSEIVSPYLKRLTYDKQADSATVESVVEAGLIGALTSLAYGGAQTAVKKVAGVNTVIPSELENVATYDEALKKGWDSNDKATVEKVSQAKAETLKTISQELANMSDDKRAKYIDKHNLGAMFNADGTLTDNYNNAYNGNMELARAYDTRYVSMGADVNVINSDIQSLTDNMVKDYAQRNNVSIEQATAESKPIQVYQGELSDKAQKSVVKAKKFTSTMSKIGLNNLNLVVVDENPMFNGVVVNGKNTYVGKDTFENGNWTKAIVHEVLHTNEDTKTYKVLADIVRKVAEGKGILDTRQQEILERYQGSDQKTVDSELTALLTEELIGNEQFIDKVVAEQPNIAMRFVKKIQNLIKLFKMSGEQRAEYKVLTLAENMYLRSAYDHGRQNLIQSIEQGREDNKQVQVDEQNAEVAVDQNREVGYNNAEPIAQYSRKKTRPYLKYETIGYENVEYLRKEVKRLFNGVNGIANNIGLSKENDIYYCDCSYDNGEIFLGIYRKTIVEDEKSRFKYLEGINERAISKGYVCDEVSKNLRRASDEYSGSGVGRQLQEELSVDKGQSKDIKERVSREDGNRGNRRLDYSLKDSQGNELTQQQAEYFRDSKIRDEQGNLLVVYHGSRNAGFTIFKTDLEGTYFTADKQYATEYAKMNNDNVYSVYLDIKKPFDTREKKARKIFEEQFYGQWGNGAPLTERGLLDWTDGADMYDFLQEKGLDYDGIIVDEGGVPTPSGVKDRGISYVAFYPEQIKLTTNLSPTSDQDIRYSLKVGNEEISGAIEETKNLVALHNLTEAKLMKILQLGGFPMPSIAITRTDLPHENYGDITIVFGRNTIDPESDSRNVVYDRDAWTPTTPKIEVKLREQSVDALIKELQDKVKGYSAYERNIHSFFDGKYRTNNGDYIVSDMDYTKESFGERAIRSSGIVAAYLSEKGVNVEPVYAERGFTMGWSSFTRKEATELFDFVGITKDITRHNATQEQRDAILEKFIEYRAKEKLSLMRRFKKDKTLTIEQVKEILRGEYDDGDVSQLFFMAEDFFNEKRPKDIYDEYATLEKMQSEITDKQDFYDWFWNKVESTFEKKGIDNDSDIFDRRGNRRSFEQRHYSYTAANIVRAMQHGDQEGNIHLGMSAGALAAKLSKRFDSIEDIREAKEYLALVSEDDLKAFNDKTYELYDELVTTIAGRTSDFMSDSSRRNDVGDILGKCAAVKPLTIENIKRKFSSETRGYNLGYKFNDQIAEQALLLFESLKHIPTTYFEAKPRRVVGFDEIKIVILPESASQEIVKALDERNINYTKYNNENSRTDIINKIDDIKFSRKSPAPSQVGDIIKAKGNLTTDKIFTKDEAKKIIADIEERLVFEDKGMVGTVKGTNELIDRLWKGLNKADKGGYTRVGVEIADYVINHTVVEDIYECLYGDTEVDEAIEVIKTLKQYFHKVKISDRVLGEIKHHFDDKASKVLSLWRAKEGGLA